MQDLETSDRFDLLPAILYTWDSEDQFEVMWKCAFVLIKKTTIGMEVNLSSIYLSFINREFLHLEKLWFYGFYE